MENTDIFRTDLKQVFDFIRFSDDKNKLKELVENNPAYEEMDEDAYDMAATYADAEELIEMRKYRGKGGKVNMCKGLQEWLEDERSEGRNEGSNEKRNQIIKNMLLRNMPTEDICAIAECEEQLVEEIRAQL